MKLLFIFILGFLVSCTAYAPQTQTSKPVEKCLNYEPEKVQLEGQLYKKSFPGPPNYTDVKKGDEEEVYWLLKTTAPFCVNENERIWAEKQTNLSDVQLILGSDFKVEPFQKLSRYGPLKKTEIILNYIKNTSKCGL